MEDNRFYFRQLLSGRDFAVGNDFATQMVNFSYAIGDRATGACLLVDPAWRDPKGRPYSDVRAQWEELWQ